MINDVGNDGGVDENEDTLSDRIVSKVIEERAGQFQENALGAD